jgi:proteasome accessory factor B
MARNRELIRQWTLLQQVATRRDWTIPKLAKHLHVSTRTVRRDLTALEAAGFPIYDDGDPGEKHWHLDARRLLDALSRNGLTVPELCALYSSRALVMAIAEPNVLTDLQGALAKIEAAVPPAMRRFLDRLPAVITAKPAFARARTTSRRHDVMTHIFQAATSQHIVSMRYHSQSSGREKDYVVHPYRLVYAQNAVYLQAFVPAYQEFRTFLIDRIRHLSVQKETFRRVAELASQPFSKSMGAYSGPTVRVKLRFASAVAAAIKDRVWHESQTLKDRTDGAVEMTLQVCDDYALRQWILGFGRSVRVIAPPGLVEWAAVELDAAREQYHSSGARFADSDVQPTLPFLFGQIAQA